MRWPWALLVATAVALMRPIPGSAARERAIEAMRKVQLAPEFADVRPIELSGGMQKRAGLARAIIARPDILFFDEPTTGLDPITADAINDHIVEMVWRGPAASIDASGNAMVDQFVAGRCWSDSSGGVI